MWILQRNNLLIALTQDMVMTKLWQKLKGRHASLGHNAYNCFS